MSVASIRSQRVPSRIRPKIPRSLADLIAIWDRYDGAIPLRALRAGLRGLRLTRHDLDGFAEFSESCYRRNRIHTGPAYELLALCWASGQRSPIHDHRGSACALRVVEGIATETKFEFSPSGLIYATGTGRLAAGSVTASYDADMHQMGNLEPSGCDLITLHVYSPPLLRMGRYYLGDAVMGEGEVALRSRLARIVAGRRPVRMKAALSAIRSRTRKA